MPATESQPIQLIASREMRREEGKSTIERVENESNIKRQFGKNWDRMIYEMN